MQNSNRLMEQSNTNKYAWGEIIVEHNCSSVTAIQYTHQFHIWAPSPELPVTYDSVMKHKTHTAEASGAGKDGVIDSIKSSTDNTKNGTYRKEKGKKMRNLIWKVEKSTGKNEN